MAGLEFKPKFIERYSKLTDWNQYEKACNEWLRKSIRINTIKISVEDLKKRLKDWKLTQIPWCKEGFWVEHKEGRRDIGNTIEHALGYFYVQEAASMIPPVVLNPKQNEAVLDVCAAPGSKTTHLGQYMENTGILLANDITGERLAALGINLQRCGLKNTAIMKSQGQDIKGNFDKILLDAPCTATGTVMKSIRTAFDWSPDGVKRVSSLQKKLIKTAFNNLRKGGILVYSTCTMEPEENEGVVDYLLKEFPDAKLEEIKLNIKRSKAILEFEKERYSKEVSKCLRIWPQDNDTEGFFVAKIKKS